MLKRSVLTCALLHKTDSLYVFSCMYSVPCAAGGPMTSVLEFATIHDQQGMQAWSASALAAQQNGLSQ